MTDFPSDPAAYRVIIERAHQRYADRAGDQAIVGITVELVDGHGDCPDLLAIDEAGVADFLDNAWDFAAKARDPARVDELPPDEAMILCAMDVMGVEPEGEAWEGVLVNITADDSVAVSGPAGEIAGDDDALRDDLRRLCSGEVEEIRCGGGAAPFVVITLANGPGA